MRDKEFYLLAISFLVFIVSLISIALSFYALTIVEKDGHDHEDEAIFAVAYSTEPRSNS